MTMKYPLANLLIMISQTLFALILKGNLVITLKLRWLLDAMWACYHSIAHSKKTTTAHIKDLQTQPNLHLIDYCMKQRIIMLLIRMILIIWRTKIDL